MTTPALQAQMQYVENCLGTGFTPSEIARALSVTEGYVSQLIAKIKEERANTGAAERIAPRLGVSEKTLKIDDLYEDIELRAAQQLHRVIPHVVDPNKLTNILARINATKRRSQAMPASGGAEGSGGVRIQLPPRAKAVFIFSSDNQAVETVTRKPVEVDGEVVEVEERRSLITASPAQLDSLAEMFKLEQAAEKNHATQKDVLALADLVPTKG